MPKHASNEPHGASNHTTDDTDKPIGLTEAFPSVGEDASPRTAADGAAIGLTEAFSAVSSGSGAHAGGFAYQGDSDEYPDALESLEPIDAPSLLFDEEAVVVEPVAQGKHGKKQKPQVPPHQRKSRRMRRILMVVVALLVFMLGALAYLGWTWLEESKNVATQQTQVQQDAQATDVLNKDQGETKDASSITTKKTDVPSLAEVLGMTKEEAVTALKHGATVTGTKEVNEEDNPIKTNVTVALTDEPADTRSGTPTVYLGLNEDDKVVQAGYSAATASLGYGSLSFIDAVQNENIIEKTLQEAGINVAAGSVKLPSDKTTYSTYATDGTTLTKENCSFTGEVELNGAVHEWSAVLLYDYTTANASGNLADTIRIIYVYINA